MSKDFYQILGVSKTATKEEIKKAYRKLAHQYHPDKKDGNEQKFKEVNEAYTVLSNDQKRAQYDQFGSGFQGFSGNTGGGQNQGFGGFDFSQFTNGGGAEGFEFDLGDIIGSMFGGRGGGSWSRARKGSDIVVDTEITFRDSILGVSKKVEVRRNNGGNENITVNIPAGIDNGEMIRYRGKGESMNQGVPGDLYIKIHVKKESNFIKDGVNVITEINIKISESILGTKKEIDFLGDKLTIKIPEKVRHGEILRIKDKGVPYSANKSGDLLLKINIEIPKKISKKAKDAIEALQNEGL
jgi:DnaJ-class molecular chaperone